MRGLTFIGISLILLTSVSCQSRYFRTNLAGRVYPADYDRNGDGITDLQAIRAGFDPADPTLATQDPDGDGLTNYWEFKLGFDPKKADSDNTKYNKQTGGNGTSDCDEDLVGDGIGLCWKLKNGFKPAEGNKSLTDADGDAYSDGEEFVASTDPNDATKRPGGGTAGSDGKVPPVLTLKGTNTSYTTSLNVTGTMSHCADGEKVLFTSSKTKPSADDAGFTDCVTTADALVGTLASGASDNRVMFVWRKIAAGVVDVPLSASILYTNRASAGGLDIIPAGDKTLAVALVPPSDAHYGTVKLLRFSEFDCSAKTLTSTGSTDTPVNPGDSLVTVSNLPLGSSYCFKVFWTDDQGNTITAHGGYDGTPPPLGTFSISGYETKTIKFAHTPPTSAKYEKLVVRRFEEQTCTTKLASEGTEVPIPMNATTYNDTNLSFGTPYCYKVFWSDNLGNNNSTTVSYAGPPTGGDLSLLGMQKTGNDAGSVELRLTRPTPEPTSTTLKRYEDATCTATTSTDVTPSGTITASYDKSDNITGFTTYCYKITWGDDFGNSQTDTVVAKFYPPAISIAPTSFTFTAPGGGTTGTANATGTVVYTANSFNSVFTNVVAGLTALLGNGAGSILAGNTATVAESDIPGLTYSTASGCENSTATVFCNTDNASGTVTGAGYSLVSNGVLNWNYTKFDQGDYTIRTMGRLNLDSVQYYSRASDGVISVTTPDLGNETRLLEDATLTASNMAVRDQYQPVIAMNDSFSTDSAQVFGIAYPSSQSQINQYIGKMTVHRQNTNNYTATFNNDSGTISNTTFLLREDNPSDPLTQGDSQYLAIASTSPSSTKQPGWIIASTTFYNSTARLRLSKVNVTNDTGTAVTAFNTASAIGSISTGFASGTQAVSFKSTSITKVFYDSGTGGESIARHGVAFVAESAPNSAVMFTKIESHPQDASVISSYIGSDSRYFQPQDGLTDADGLKIALPKSVVVAVGTYPKAQVQIQTASESGTNYFYLGWQEKSSIKFARAVADGYNPPHRSLSPDPINNPIDTAIAVTTSNVGGSIASGPLASTDLGKPSYGMAPGNTNSQSATPILGVFYNKNANDNCYFTAMKTDYTHYPPTLTKVATGSPEELAITNLSGGAICRFPHIFWNPSNKKFMALWLEDRSALSTTETKVKYAEFSAGLSVTGSLSLNPSSPIEIIISNNRVLRNLVCGMSATFDPPSEKRGGSRIGVVTLETDDDCQSPNSATSELRFDMYKPSSM